MSARDSIHDAVVNALLKDGREITDDPLAIEYGSRNFLVDLAASREQTAFVGFEREQANIAVEIKAFSGPSPIKDLEHAIGQYVVYNLILEEIDPERQLLLAVDQRVFIELFEEPIGELVRERLPLPMIAVNCLTEEIVQWLPPPTLID